MAKWLHRISCRKRPSHNIFSSFQSKVQHAVVCLATSFRLWLQLVDVQSKERGWTLLFLNIYPRQSSTCKKQPWPGLNLPAVEAAPAGYRQETCSCPWVIELCHKPATLWKETIRVFETLKEFERFELSVWRSASFVENGSKQALLRLPKHPRRLRPHKLGTSSCLTVALQSVIAKFLFFVHIFSILICK